MQDHHYTNVLQALGRVWERGREYGGACPSDVGLDTYHRLQWGDLGMEWIHGAIYHAADGLRQMTGERTITHA